MVSLCRKVSVLLTIAMLAIVCAPEGHCIAHKIIQEGGPFVCKETAKLQRFKVKLSVSAEQAKLPLYITFYNGYGGRPGYSWMRVFLQPRGQSGEYGQILINERTFLRLRAKTLDISGRVPSEGTTLFIEGEGRKGSIFSFALSTAARKLSLLNATKISAGKSFLLHGTGFGNNASAVRVFVDNKPARIESVSSRVIRAIAPSKTTSKSSSVKVTVNGQTTNTIRVAASFLPPVLTQISPLGGPVGGTLLIRGANFSRLANRNIVHVGPYTAPVLKVNDTGTLLVRIPNWSGSSGTLPVTVVSNGVPSRNHLSFWCTPHYYGGDPNAPIYSYD